MTADETWNKFYERASKEIVPAELAAWTSVARTILNLHEAITRN